MTLPPPPSFKCFFEWSLCFVMTLGWRGVCRNAKHRDDDRLHNFGQLCGEAFKFCCTAIIPWTFLEMNEKDPATLLYLCFSCLLTSCSSHLYSRALLANVPIASLCLSIWCLGRTQSVSYEPCSARLMPESTVIFDLKHRATLLYIILYSRLLISLSSQSFSRALLADVPIASLYLSI